MSPKDWLKAVDIMIVVDAWMLKGKRMKIFHDHVTQSGEP
jgi:hypothetical protein